MRRRNPIRIIDLRNSDTAIAVSQLRSREPIPQKITRVARRIIKDVEAQGDRALLDYTKRLDGADLTPDTLRVSTQEIKDSYRQVSEAQLSALRFAQRRIARFEQAVMAGLKPPMIDENGVRIRQKIVPLESVGCYVPGGRASYPSSLLMTVTPAKAAGVERIAVASPPAADGAIPPVLLAAADICGVEEFYRMGGAQAIAALAYGTKTVQPVEKIVGPGNIYVTAAKQIVSGVVATDLQAGPSEILILADASADPRFIVRDLLSQAEHGPDSVCGVATDSPDLARKISDLLAASIDEVERKEIVNSSIKRRGFIAVCRGVDQMVEFADRFAPEHLEILTAEPSGVADRIASAGLILLGPYSPVAASDYCVGTNHVLPTGGWARRISGLSAPDFVRRMDIVECTKRGLKGLRSPAALLASSEGLPNHASALEERFEGENT